MDPPGRCQRTRLGGHHHRSAAGDSHFAGCDHCQVVLVGDEGSVYSVSRAQLESDLVSGISENGRAPVALLDVSNFNDGYALAPDACTGLIFLTDHDAGEIRSFDPVSGEISLVADGLDCPASTLVLYRKDAGCSAALRFLVADTGGADQGISLIDPAGPEALSFAAFPSPNHLLFIPEGLGIAGYSATGGSAI